MIEFENYNDNLEIDDKHGHQGIPSTKSVIYNGSPKLFQNLKSKESGNAIPPLAAAVVGLNNTATALTKKSGSPDISIDIDVQENYLNSKPTCYLILGKPGSGAYCLGEAMSKKYNCIHLCPKNLILDEIEQGSPTGKCMSFNLKQQKVLKYDLILSLLKKKLASSVVKHRGYIVSGLPLVSSDRKVKYLTSTLFSEEAVRTVDELLYDTIANLKKKSPKKAKVEPGSPNTSITSDVEEQEEEAVEELDAEEHAEEEADEQPVALPKFVLDTCSGLIVSKKIFLTTKKTIVLQQFYTIFKTDMPPDIVIYLTTPDKDLVTKKSRKYFNYSNNTFTFDNFLIKCESDLRWPAKYNMSDYIRPHETHIFNPKYSCRQPINFEVNSTIQMCNYKNDVLPSIEEKLKDFDQKHVIKIDARNSVHQMMYQINETLILLSIKPVLIPEPLYLEEPPDDMEDFWKLVEELNVIRSGVLSFNRYSSLWLNRCPVELKKRRSITGKSKYAVSFFKHVYLLSSLTALIAFCRNPRPYLKMQYLEPTCRIIVIGTPFSGKTLICQCLSWLYDTKILNYNLFLEEEKKKKYTSFATTILSEIIPTIEDARLIQWQNLEIERKIKLKEWHTTVSKDLKKFLPILIEILKYSTQAPVSETFIAEEDDTEPSEELLKNYNDIQQQISFLPFLDDVDECLNALKDQNLLKFAPLNLLAETEKPTIPILGDDDVTKAISNYITTNEMQKDLEPTTEELMTEFTRILFKIDEESIQNNDVYGKFIIDGFPSDPEFWDYLIEANLLPDYTIALLENRELDSELIQHYTDKANLFIIYQDTFAMANDPLINIKRLTTCFPDSKKRDTEIILDQLLFSLHSILLKKSEGLEENEEKTNSEFKTSFTACVEKFREDWDSVKLNIEDNFKSYVEIELENKSDVNFVEEVLLKLRKSNYLTCEPNEDEEPEPLDEEDAASKDMLTYNDSRYLGETNIYCPIAFYDYGVLWEGKSEFGIKYNNKIYNFSKEECMEKFQKDVTRYQEYNKPLKSFPPLRLCVIGSIGSGKTTVSKLIAKELGLLHVDFSEFINNYLMPKHFKKVGRQYENSVIDTPIDEEGVMEFQMDEGNENLVSDILGNEHELRGMIYNYFERGAPIISVLMLKLLKKLWFEIPFKNTGFVLDGYPRLPSDVEDLVAGYCIPDLIIELESSAETSLERLSPKMFKIWKTQLNEAKIAAKKKLDTERLNWMNFVTKQVVVKLVFEDLLDLIFGSLDEPSINQTESDATEPQPHESRSMNTNLVKFYNETIEEYPAPVDNNEWEKPDEARERIDARIESVYEVDDEGIQSLKDILMEQKIKIVSVSAIKPLNKVLRTILFKLTELRNRTDSLFEQNFIINCDIADMLLLEGFFFLSKFNRLCPVHVFENPEYIINPYMIIKRKENVFPVIHRSFIYYTFGEENLKKFRNNPLKYICSNLLNSHIEYPLSIAVIGSPKSGKSVLARKLAKRFGLICLSRGTAIRYILDNLYWTELASRMQSTLRDGNCIDVEYIIKAVQCVLMDHRTLAYGFVFDGFPDIASEAMELLGIGVYPLIVFDVSSTKEKICSNSQNEIYYDIIKRMPPYSFSFIDYRFTHWRDSNYKVRNWIRGDIQNLLEINGKESKWQCLQDAINHIKELIPKIHYYLYNVKSNIVTAGFMCVSNDKFREKMSTYKDLCPLCLQINIIKYSGYPVDKKGVVQFKNKFYWICNDHMSVVLKSPKLYLLFKEVDIPEIPAPVKTVNVSLVYENGICIVTYAENLPAQKIVRASRVPVPDERYDYLCEYHKPASKVPAFLNVVDIAGLVKGAAEGQGLGNAFLSHIKACDAIFNLCRAFDDEDVIHVDGEVNPVRDLETIAEELRLKDEEQLMQNFEKLDRVVSRGGDKKLKPEYDSLTRIKAVLVDEKKHIRFGDWSAADIEVLNKYLFITSKPALYLVNLSEKDYIRKKNKWLPKLKEWIDKNDPGAALIPFSGVLETKLMDMEPAEKQAFLKEHNITGALDKIIIQGYKALQLEYFFTAGADEVKAWTIQKGTKAPQAAGRIHTDFEKGFIMAEVMHFKDFKEEGTEAACKAAGKYRQQGRNYVVEDGDIIFFKFNAGAGLKDAKKK